MTEKEKETLKILRAREELYRAENYNRKFMLFAEEYAALRKLTNQEHREQNWSYNFRYKIEPINDPDVNEQFIIRFQPINPELVGQSGKFRGTSAEYIWDYLTNKIDFIRNVHSWNPVSYTSYSLEWNYFPNYKEIEVNNSYNFMSILNKENSNIMTLTLTDEAETICLDYDRYWAQTYISKYNTPPTEQIGFYNKALDIIKVDLLKQLDLFAKLYSLR